MNCLNNVFFLSQKIIRPAVAGLFLILIVGWIYMCGRYSLGGTSRLLEERFDAKLIKEYLPRYNAAPSQDLPVIFNDNEKQIEFSKWGLRPAWAMKFKRDGIINVRTETLVEKHTFKGDLQKRRCLVLSDGFYEWQREGKTKTPFRFILKDEKPFAFAGIWEINKLETGEEIKTFAIITTTANSVVGKIHDRMPVILNEGDEHEWLENPDLKLLKPFSPTKMKMYQVSTMVNNAKIDKVDIVKPIV